MNELIMKKINGRNLLHDLKANTLLICFYFFALFSYSAGVLFFRQIDENLVNDLFKNFYSVNETATFLSLFLNSFLGWIIYLALMYFSGLSILGFFAVPIFMFFKISGFGIIGGYLYSNFSLNGITFYLLTVVPCLIICISVFCFASKESFAFSRLFFKIIKRDSKPTKFHSDFKLFSLRFIIFAAIVILANIIDALCKMAFSGFFEF